MRNTSFYYRNGLSLVIFAIFIVFLCGQAFTGWHEYNSEEIDNGREAVSMGYYLSTSHFIEATFENWESEFLQMGMYVVFTVFLRQKGSSESKSLDKKEEVDREPEAHAGAPWPVKKGGIFLMVYRNSLSLAFIILFLLSFTLHTVSSHNNFNRQQVLEGKAEMSLSAYLCHSRLWFESFQNWQSEFIAVLSIVLLSVFLRQQGSPESKPVDAPNSETGSK